jgi:hypothetical protein
MQIDNQLTHEFEPIQFAAFDHKKERSYAQCIAASFELVNVCDHGGSTEIDKTEESDHLGQ